MGKHIPEVEWQILDEQREGRQVAALSHAKAEMPASNQRTYRLYAYATCLLFLLLLGGAWLWYQAQAGVEQVETELQGAAQAEIWVAANHDIELAIDLAADPIAAAWHRQFARDDSTLSTLQASTPDSPLTVDLHVIELEEQWAKVQMTASAAGENVAYRQTRFYHKTAEGWLRTAPSVQRWGAPASLESEYFIFDLRQQDAEVMAEIAPQLDLLYITLRQTLGLATSTGRAKLLVEISPTELPGAALLRSTPAHRFVVPSPSLYLAPMSITDAELVVQSLALLFVRDVLDEAIESYGIYWVREQMLGTLYLWVIWDLDLPLTAWRQEIVAWRLARVQADSQEESVGLPHRYTDLCAVHTVWLPSPALISIPLSCNEQGHSPIPPPGSDLLSTTRFEELTYNIFWQTSNPQRAMQWAAEPGDTVLLTTLIDYIVSRYGRQQVPDLLAALGEHKSWATLSPAVFGLSSAEFAQGWQRYLVEQYGMDRGR